MICKPCRAGQHEKCDHADCDCPSRVETEDIERRLKAIRSTDERLAGAVYTTLLYGGSDIARQLTEHAGSDAVRLFVQQVIGTLKAVNC